MGLLKSTFRNAGRILPAALYLMVFSLSAFPVQGAAPYHLQENKIKAGLLYNFLKYTQWPTDGNAAAPFEVCLYGGDSFEGALDPLQGRTAQQRPINIHTVYDLDGLQGCNVAFINRSQKDKLADILKVVSGQKTMTMSDINDFSRRGGMVEFSSPEDKRIHLYMNYQTIAQSGLSVGNELAKLGEAVN